MAKSKPKTRKIWKHVQTKIVWPTNHQKIGWGALRATRESERFTDEDIERKVWCKAEDIRADDVLFPTPCKFHIETTQEITEVECADASKIVAESVVEVRKEMWDIDLPMGGEIMVSSKVFECRNLEERIAHAKWEREILSRGKPIRDAWPSPTSSSQEANPRGSSDGEPSDSR
jgi:hypothetical protein